MLLTSAIFRGFGSQMADTPMVIMWENSDGSMTLSQRQAPAEVMPTLVPDPPRVATLAPQLSSVSAIRKHSLGYADRIIIQLGGNTPTYAYTIPVCTNILFSIPRTDSKKTSAKIG